MRPAKLLVVMLICIKVGVGGDTLQLYKTKYWLNMFLKLRDNAKFIHRGAWELKMIKFGTRSSSISITPVKNMPSLNAKRYWLEQRKRWKPKDSPLSAESNGRRSYPGPRNPANKDSTCHSLSELHLGEFQYTKRYYCHDPDYQSPNPFAN